MHINDENHYYGGSEKNWSAYLSLQERFVRYYSKKTGYFNNDMDSVYDKVRITDFYFYIDKETKLEKEHTLKNAFFYLKRCTTPGTIEWRIKA